MENAKKTLVFHFGVGRQASFHQIWYVKNSFHKNLQLINYEILFRDTFLYAASVDSRGLDATVEILGEVVLRPQITDDELKMVFYVESIG